jgi:hypothetical protein
MTESDHQVAIIQWFRSAYPEWSGLLYSCPSGFVSGGRNKFALIAKLKREGWRIGVSDLILDLPRGHFHGLRLELKDQGKTRCSVKDEQHAYIDDMLTQGYMACWAPGSDFAIKVIKAYINLGEFSNKK